MQALTSTSPYLALLKNRVNLNQVPFSERGARLMLFRADNHFKIRLAERWFKLDNQLAGYRTRAPIVDAWTLTDATGDALPLPGLEHRTQVPRMADDCEDGTHPVTPPGRASTPAPRRTCTGVRS